MAFCWWSLITTLPLITISIYLLLRRKKTFVSDLHNKAVFITGCDSGFGFKLTQHLDKLGVTVFAGCLSPNGPGARTLQSTCSHKLQLLKIDVTIESDIEEAVETIQSQLKNKELWAIVNNAGVMPIGNMEWMTTETMNKVFNVNTFGPFKLTKAFLPVLRKSRGRIVFVASLAGHTTVPGLGAYCMSKHAIISLANAFRTELKYFGISVHTIKPFTYRTNLNNVETMENTATINFKNLTSNVKAAYGENYLQKFKKHTLGLWTLWTHPEERIHEVIDALVDASIGKNPKSEYIPGILGRTLHFLDSHLPSAIVEYVKLYSLPTPEPY